MRGGARVGDERAMVVRDAFAVERTGPLAGGDGHAEQAAGRRVEDHASACARAGKPLGQFEQPAQPVEHMGLQFRAGRRRGPEHALHAQARGQKFAEDRWPARARGKVGEESGMLPMRQARHDDAVEVGEHGVERLRLLGWMRWQLRSHPARLDLRQHRLVGDRLPVVGDPVDDCAALAAEAFGIEGGQGIARHAVVTPRAA